MAAQNPPGPSAYAVSPTINPITGAQVVDPNDEIIPTVPQPNLLGPGAAGSSPGGYVMVSTQVLTALLIEARVQTRLMADPAALGLELDMLRAEEAIAASGGVLN